MCDCYLELARKVGEELAELDPYFLKLSKAMVTWIEAWKKLNPELQ